MNARISCLLFTLFLVFDYGFVTAQFSLPLGSFKITSAYSIRLHPTLKMHKFHSGIDLSARYEPVFSIFSGLVTELGENEIIGKYVKITNGNLQGIYGHLSFVALKKGEWISAGAVLGLSGNTGRSTGPHLHLSIKISEKFVNPLAVINALLAINIKTYMEKTTTQTDNLSLAAMLVLLAQNGRVVLSEKQAQEYGTDVSDELPIEEEGEEDDY
ncbi:M23 family metallopeptidase [Pedobacter sp. Leaf132]|uniref:M23 family metallopeptidase n=1 Tax=Pedobacter sp. Leaf132 TaxID=2876557 RepID=UPI001E54266E|nr:M23 family metallopeptidase [Pedobacter sp. Leaf132]